MKNTWTKDGKYFGSQDQVDAYDRGEEVIWKNQIGEKEIMNLDKKDEDSLD